VDTPGVLSGEKQRTQRSYDFTGVTSWFAAKCDLILLLFDPHKLDISDEFKRVITSLRGNDDKIRVVLNKADQIDTQQLMRVYGALMWSLGKVLNTPEVMRVYIGSYFYTIFPVILSFWQDNSTSSQNTTFSIEDKRLEVDFYVCSLVLYHANGMSEVISRLKVDSRMVLWHDRSFNDKPINEQNIGPIGRELFEREQNDLLADLKDVPRKSCDRRVCLFTP
jgi:hypothetical protein